MKPFDHSGNFVPSPETTGEIRRLTVRGAGATLVAGGIGLTMQMVATVFLARLLMPRDFGVVAMVTTFSLLFVNFGFNGLTEAIVQREEMNHILVTTLFWINLGAGVLLTGAFAAGGSLLARFFHDSAVRGVAEGISLSIVTTSVSTVHLALLKRAMRFTLVSSIDICSRAASVVVSILFAKLGYGYWALVIGVIAQPVVQSTGALILCRWMPGVPRGGPGVGAALRFAMSTYGYFSVNYFSRNTDNLLVGWRFDAQLLGYYKKAYDLFALSANQLVASIAIVVVAGLSRLRKDDALYRRYLLDAIGLMAFVGMGLAAVLTLAGTDLILLLLGPKWQPAGRIFTFFGPGVGAMILYYTQSWIHLSVGRPDRWFRWAIVEFVFTFSLFVACLHWGPIGIALAWSVSYWILTVPAIWYAGRPIQLTAASVIAVVWRYIAASLISLLVTAFGMNRLHPFAGRPQLEGAFLRLMLVVAIEMPLYLGAVTLLHGGLRPIRSFLSIIRDMTRARRIAGNSIVTDQTLPAPLATDGTVEAIACSEITTR